MDLNSFEADLGATVASHGGGRTSVKCDMDKQDEAKKKFLKSSSREYRFDRVTEDKINPGKVILYFYKPKYGQTALYVGVIMMLVCGIILLYRKFFS